MTRSVVGSSGALLAAAALVLLPASCHHKEKCYRCCMAPPKAHGGTRDRSRPEGISIQWLRPCGDRRDDGPR